jgi:aquaporin Z
VDEPLKRAEAGVLGWIDREVTEPLANFQDPKQEWRRLFSELYGTFLLVIVAAGGGMMGEAFPNTITRTAAVVALHEVIKVSAKFGSNYPASGYSGGQAYLMEALLTLGLVSVILGTASGAQNIGIFGAIGVGAYIALAGLWGSPISGASMNPARTFGPDLVGRDFGEYWVYVAGPLTGALIAVGFAYVLRGSGGGRSGSAAAQGELFTETEKPTQA